MKKLFLMMMLFIPLAASANGVGNGGDMCENRFKLISDDIRLWILNLGSAGLKLPVELSYTQYNQGMLQQISSAKVSCTDEKIFIGESEKTCKNYVAKDGKTHINCNVNRFMNTSESDQYILVHHEYAGLAGFEVNTGEDSNYEISNQLSEYLENKLVKKLAVKKPSISSWEDPFDEKSCQGEDISLQEVAHLFRPGDDTVTMPYQIFQRNRKCNSISGCGSWEPPIAFYGLGTLTLKVEDNNQIFIDLTDLNPNYAYKYFNEANYSYVTYVAGHSDKSCGFYTRFFVHTNGTKHADWTYFFVNYKFTNHCLRFWSEPPQNGQATEQWASLIKF